MSAEGSAEITNKIGPSGFIELNGNMLVVDYGKVYLDGSQVGFLFEDGFFQKTCGPLGDNEGYRAIDEITGCIFRGIDSCGMELFLPSQSRGPTGVLTYNDVVLNVTNGRLSTQYHELVGEFTDDGTLFVRDKASRVMRRKMDEATLLTLSFTGKKSDEKPWQYEFIRPLFRKNKRYSENETIRYFEGFDQLTSVQKKYVLDSLRLWAASGLLQVVRKKVGNAALGNVRHGAAGVTGVRTGNVTLYREEFEIEVDLTKRFGALLVAPTKVAPYLEVRLNQVVSHEFGHQLEFILSQANQRRIAELYERRLASCDKIHPLPSGYEGYSELLTPQQVHERIFVSGYSRSSSYEYWAEAVAAFSIKESRDVLKKVDPAVHDILAELVTSPEKMVSPDYVEQTLDLRASLRVGGELTDDLLSQ